MIHEWSLLGLCHWAQQPWESHDSEYAFHHIAEKLFGGHEEQTMVYTKINQKQEK